MDGDTRMRVAQRVIQEALIETRLGGKVDEVKNLLGVASRVLDEGVVSEEELKTLPPLARHAIQTELGRRP